jgi:hypothetical protein
MGIAHARRRFGESSRAAAESHVLDDLGVVPQSPYYFLCDPNFQPNNLECMMLEKDCRQILNLNIPFETIYFRLPEEYYGYQTKQLLELYGLANLRKRIDTPPQEMVLAMWRLLYNYHLVPVHQLPGI